MKAGVYYAAQDIRVEEVPDPQIKDGRDVIVKVTYSCICGSDLWWYRGLSEREKGQRTGHEFIGVVEEIGSEVNRIKKGDLVIAPFKFSDGTCPECLAGATANCRHGGVWGGIGVDGGQGEKVRVPFADTTLSVVPESYKDNEKLMPSLLALSDVMCTGYHAAVCAGVSEGKTVAVIGDGAVGLCAVLAARYLQAKQIILLSRHEDRSQIGKSFGASEVVFEKGEEGVQKIKDLTGDLGVDCVLECVGSKQAWEEGLGMLRKGGRFGFVGLPHDVADIEAEYILDRNIGIMGGIAHAGRYIPDLLPAVLSGELNPGEVFTKTISLDELKSGYEDMDKRETIKTMIKF